MKGRFGQCSGSVKGQRDEHVIGWLDRGDEVPRFDPESRGGGSIVPWCGHGDGNGRKTGIAV